MGCPDENTLAAYADGALDGDRLDGLETHMSSCEDCRALVGALGSDTAGFAPTQWATAVGSQRVTVAGSRRAAADGSDRATAPGSKRAKNDALAADRSDARAIGRFELLGVLGRGGMGVVHEARDSTLDRLVAIKLVRGGSGGLRADARDRLLREARSLARLAHPNVVPIHEAGIHNGELFVAMELIDGVSLESWLETDRDWREVANVFALAGDGLAAAHSCELVHRDFKPSNVMVNETAAAVPTVKVVDFGLARVASFASVDDAPFASVEDLEDIETGEELDSERLTRTGGFVGTPAYASPEQLLGTEASARSDIFSFSVALFEALTGERPHRGRSRAELARAIKAGPEPTLLKRLPRALRSIVASGLRYEPHERPASIVQVTAALRRALGRRRTRLMVRSAVGLSLALVLVVALAFRSGGEPPCAGADDDLVGVWDISTRGAVVAAILESGSPVAIGRARAVSAALDEYSERWIDERTSACQATARAEQSSELRDLRFACYQRKLAELRATTVLLREVDEAIVRRSLDVVGGLGSLEECADASRLLALETASPASGSAASDLEAMVSRAEALARAGQIDEGLKVATEASDQAMALDDQRIISRAHEALATLDMEAGKFDDGIEAYRTALFAAVASKDSDAEARIAGDLARELTFNRLDKSLAANYVDHAKAALRRGVRAEARAATLLGIAGYHYHVNELAESEAAVAEVLEHSERIEAPKRLQVRAAALSLKAGIADLRGELSTAEASYREAVELYSQIYGSNHERVAATSESLGHVYRRLGRAEDASARFRAAWKIRETLAGDFNDLSRLQVAALVSEDIEETERLNRAAVAAATRLFGATHPWTGAALDDHATTLGDLNRWKDAEAAALKAVEIVKAFEHAEPSQLAKVTLTLSSAQHETGQYDAALASAKRAAELIARSEFDSSVERIMVHLQLADTYSAQEQWSLACPLVDELAISIPAVKVLGEIASEFIEIGVAMCDWELNADRAALDRVEAGVEKIRGRDEDLDLEIPEIMEWLADARRGKRGLKRPRR